MTILLQSSTARLVMLLAMVVCIGLLIIWLGKSATGVYAASCGTSPTTKAEGLVSAFSIDPNFTSSGCVSGSLSYIPLNQTRIVISDYASLFNKYYQRNTTATKITLDQPTYNNAIGGLGVNTLLYRNGDLTLQGNVLSNVGGGNVLVFFVNGDLNIQTNITEAQSSSSGGVVFVVKGKVNIDKAVTSISSVIVAQGSICSACDTSGIPSNNPVFPFDQPLMIYGSLISLDGSGNSLIRFVRKFSNNFQPAETINAEAKYLVILKDIFGERVKIYKEI